MYKNQQEETACSKKKRKIHKIVIPIVECISKENRRLNRKPFCELAVRKGEIQNARLVTKS